MATVRVPAAPSLPTAPNTYDRLYFENIHNVLRLFFVSVTNSLSNPSPVAKKLLRVRDATYNVSPIDAFSVLVFDSGSASTLNVLSTSALRQEGEYLEVINTGSGTVTVSAGAGVTLNPTSPTIAADSKILLLYLGSNQWFAA